MKECFKTYAIGSLVALFISSAAARETVNFDSGWRFIKADVQGSEAAAFDDSGWRTLNLPHDWGVEGPFDINLPGQTGKLPWVGKAWYRKTFQVAARNQDEQIFIDFDGAMSHAKVWMNGEYAGEWPYGYSSFRLDVTPFIRFGTNNVVAVRLDNPPDSSRWYPGGGIYRHVHMVTTAPVHVAHWGTYVTTPEVSAERATVRIVTEIENQSAKDACVVVQHEIFEDSESPVKVAGQIAFKGLVTAGTNTAGECQITLASPKLWDLKSPHLYYVQTSVLQDGKTVDSYKTEFGVRTIQFIADKGFLLNGRIQKIQGVCLHSDLGPLGTTVNTRGIRRQLKIMKEMGCNAIRTSHNPPAPALLDLCDRMGLLVMDEAFDCWKAGKLPNDYSTLFDKWHERDLTAMIHRDRNHPSVVIWSTGNEVMEQWDKYFNLDLSRQLAAIAHREDPTRPATVTCNHAEAGFNGFAETVDVFGYNYKPHLYQKFREAHPDIPLLGSETASSISSRGEYFFPVSDDKTKGCGGYFQVSSYDLSAATWATTPDTEFAAQDQIPEVLGEFVWTGFDYLGEPTPYNKDKTNLLNFNSPEDRKRAEQELARMGGEIPSRSSYFGIVDLCGFKKDRFYIYQAHWRPDFPMVHILPHWNWPERIGQVTPVFVYTSGDETELFLNGKSLGCKKKGAYEYRLRWDDVVYQPGELKAVAYKDGKKWAEETVRTTGPAQQVGLSADRQTISADGCDLSFITVKIADSNGLMVPRSDNLVKFSLAGPGELVAVGNGNATSLEPFIATQRKAYNGLCLAVIRSLPGRSGDIRLTAESDGLQSAEITISSR